MKNYPLRDPNNLIYDPFKGQEVQIGFKSAANKHQSDLTERKKYTVHRACGHCRGAGKRRDDNSPGIAIKAECSQCLLSQHTRGREATEHGFREVWGKTIEVFAFELKTGELNHLEPNKKMGAIFQINQHQERRRIARIMSDVEVATEKAVVISRVCNF